jgi:hypothetical protein
VLARVPEIPTAKALLSADGGICPEDGATLEFDPWSPRAHRCAGCGHTYTGERHDRAWARWQHLLAERTADVPPRGPGTTRGGRPRECHPRGYAELSRYPNRDNVLGPARLFFSTYLGRSGSPLPAAASLLRRRAPEPEGGGVSAVADEAANLIGEFDEASIGRPHNAAPPPSRSGRGEEPPPGGRGPDRHPGPSGVVRQRRDVVEGENYSPFALRGQLLAMGWAAQVA